MSKPKKPNLFYINPREMGWWVAVLFMIGSLIFAAGALFSLGLGNFKLMTINLVFFTGSIFFTLAAYFQTLIAIRAAARKKVPGKEITPWFGWYPADKSFMANFIQWIGTLLFNVNTLMACMAHLTWLQMEIEVWTPDIIGCLCFLASSVMAYDASHMKVFSLKPKDISWWVLRINLWGSIFFMLAGIFAFVIPHTTDLLNAHWANIFTFWGALCFFIAAYLTIPEMSRPEKNMNDTP